MPSLWHHDLKPICISLTFLYKFFFDDAGKLEKRKWPVSKRRSRAQMETLLVSSELTKRSSLYFQQLSRERTTLWGSLKWLLCPNVSCPLTGSGPNLALNRGASCQGDTLPYSPQNLGHQAFQSIRPITNQISRPKLETKSSILLLYLSEATLRAITTIACEEKLAI